MKRSLCVRIFFIVVFLLVAVAFAAAQQITILHVNDTHSHLDAWGPKDANLDGTLGGLGKAASVIGAEKMADPQALFVHAGDLIHGDPFFNAYLGVPELKMLDGLGLTAMAVGNHEFQYGPVFLASVVGNSTISFPLVSSNLNLDPYPPLKTWIASTATKDSNGVKVGFFGITTPFDVIEQPSPVVIYPDIAAKAEAAVLDLRNQGAQVVICLCHIGMPLSRQLAQGVDGIDVIVNGHDHVALTQPETVASPSGTTIIVSAGEYYRWVGRLRLNVNGAQVSMVDYALLPVDGNVPAYPGIQNTVNALKAGIVAQYGDIYHTTLTRAASTIGKTYDPDRIKRDTALGDLIADAYRSATGTDIALEAGGFINEDLPYGPLVGADVFRTMSYAMPTFVNGKLAMSLFRLETFKISGADLLKGLEFSLTNEDLFPQVSGLRFEMDSRKPEYQRIVPGSVHINGQKLVLTRMYSVTANEGFVMFLPKLGLTIQDLTPLSITGYDAIKQALMRRSAVNPATDGRVRDIGSVPGKN